MTTLEATVFGKLETIDARGARLEGGMSALAHALRRPAAQPFYFRKAGSGTVNAAGDDLVIDLGGPTQGEAWNVLALTVGGLTWATAAAGTALLVIAGQTPTNAASVGLAAVVDEAASLPLPSGYSRGQVALKYGDRLYVIVVGGTIAQQYVAAIGAEQYEEAIRSQTAAV